MCFVAGKFGEELHHLQSQHATAIAGLRQRQRAVLQAQQEQQLEDLEQQREQLLQQQEEQVSESGVVATARNEALLHTARAVGKYNQYATKKCRETESEREGERESEE